MKAQTVEIKHSVGRVLCRTIYREGGKRVLAKGHRLAEEDVRMLGSEGILAVSVTELQEGEIDEDEAALEVANAIGCGSVEIRQAAGGRANLFASEMCCVLVDEQLLRYVNAAGGLAIATAVNLAPATAGQRIATVKSFPFGVAQAQLEVVQSLLKEKGPILQARPIRAPAVGVLYSDPVNGAKANQLFENVMRQRLERLGAATGIGLSSVEDEGAVTVSLKQLLASKPTLIVVASTTAPAGPDDVVGRAMSSVGCQFESFLAPVEPGNLLLLGYKNEVPIVCAPGCFRSAKPNVLDLVLPPLLARYHLSSWDIASLGHGGLLA